MKKILFPLVFSCISIVSIAQQKGALNTSQYVPFAKVEKAPTYPGCETLRENLQKLCLQTQIKKHVANNFNMSVADNLDLDPGKKRVYVQFVISKDGQVEQIRARGPHQKLENEGIRVVSLLPKMMPAQQKGKSVNIKYTLPITLFVENNSRRKRKN